MSAIALNADVGEGFDDEPLYAQLDPENTGGAMLLGVDGVCIISHGSSSAKAIVNACRVAAEMVQADVVGALRQAVAPA